MMRPNRLRIKEYVNSPKLDQNEQTHRYQKEKRKDEGLFSRIMGLFSKVPKKDNMEREEE